MPKQGQPAVHREQRALSHLPGLVFCGLGVEGPRCTYSTLRIAAELTFPDTEVPKIDSQTYSTSFTPLLGISIEISRKCLMYISSSDETSLSRAHWQAGMRSCCPSVTSPPDAIDAFPPICRKKITMTFPPSPIFSIIQENKKKPNANRFPGYNPSQTP